ncbi:CapA family protein [Hamadaea flava]|uniref:CapA family protein n=1 Tax=Hamadaea flava TaxID=1742688 RepID=UPI0020A5DECB|nr:CapA family protein [Hamadaea flava]
MKPRLRHEAVVLLTVLAVASLFSTLAAAHPSSGRAAPTAAPAAPQPTVRTTLARSSAAAPQSTTSPDWQPRRFTVVGTGDVLLHQGLWQQARVDGHGRGMDFRPLFAGIKPIIAGADLAICHMETPLGRPGGPFTGYPVFQVPPQVVPALKDTGFDSCSTASNHSLDAGLDGIRRTLDALDAAGLAHTGTARSPQERATTTLLTVAGVRVGQLSYAFGFNGIPRPKGKEWAANLIKPATILADARTAKQRGAEIVIVSLHWGTEYQHAATAEQASIARTLLASPDIDLILGHHAHVVQPFEQIGGEWVAYGHGNLVSTQSFSADTRDGVISRFTFAESAPGQFHVVVAEALPVYMRLGSGAARILLVSSCVRGKGSTAAECAASGRRTTKVIRSRRATVLIA